VAPQLPVSRAAERSVSYSDRFDRCTTPARSPRDIRAERAVRGRRAAAIGRSAPGRHRRHPQRQLVQTRRVSDVSYRLPHRFPARVPRQQLILDDGAEDLLEYRVRMLVESWRLWGSTPPPAGVKPFSRTWPGVGSIRRSRYRPHSLTVFGFSSVPPCVPGATWSRTCGASGCRHGAASPGAARARSTHPTRRGAAPYSASRATGLSGSAGGCQDRGVSTADIRDRQLQRCCDALDAVDPGAATLCAGWSAHDLALHLWSIKREPLAWAGMLLPVLAPLTRQRAERLRSESGAIACMPLDRWEDDRHALGEYYVHTQDVARPNGVLQPALDDELQEALWLRTLTAARILRRRLPAGLVLEHPDGRRAASSRGRPEVVVSGAPSELICWVYGRQSVAAVTVRGK
jgi:uncharacterized protein (TIGR03085 family)